MLRLFLASAVLLASAAAEAGELTPALDALVAEAGAAGLPTTPLELKAREGLAKGVPESRVAAVLGELVTTYERARAVLPGTTPAEIEAAADALRAGASDDALRRLSAVAPQVRPQALRSLADLLYLRVGEAQATRLVVSASRRGGSGLSGLASATAALVSGGATPGEAARAVGLAVAQGRAPLAALPANHQGPPQPGGNPGLDGGRPHGNPNGGNPNSGGNPNNGNHGNGGNQGNAGGRKP